MGEGFGFCGYFVGEWFWFLILSKFNESFYVIDLSDDKSSGRHSVGSMNT